MSPKIKIPLLLSTLVVILGSAARGSVDKVDIRDYGALGGNLAADSAALAAAWQVAINTGAPLFIPPGTYYVSNNLVFNRDLSPLAFKATPRFSILGAGSAASTLVFVGTNSTLLSIGPGTVQVTVRDLAFKNGGGGANRAIASVQVGGPCLFENCLFEGFRWVAVDMDTRAGGYVYGCGFSYNNVGLRLGGYSDGWTVDTRIDRNVVGIEVGGPSIYDSGATHHANASRVHVVGGSNRYGIVVGRCFSTRISGYMESSTNAFVSIGHPPELYPSLTDSYVGTVEVDGMIMANIAATTMTNGIAIYTKPYAVTIRNSQYTDYGNGAMVHVMNASAEGATYSFQDMVCVKALTTSSGDTYKTANGVSGPNWLHISPTGEYRYYASNYSYQGDNWTRLPGQLGVNADRSQAFGVANFFGPQNYQILCGSLTNANQAKVSRIGAFSYQGDAYPLTLMSANNTTAASQELYVGGGTSFGRPISAGSLYAGSPSAGPGAGNLALKWYNDGSVSIGSTPIRSGSNSLAVGANLKVLGVAMARRFVGPISGAFVERGTLSTNAFDSGALALLRGGSGGPGLASSMVQGGLLRPDLLVANPDQTTNAGWMIALSNGVRVASSDGGALTNLNAGALVGSLPSSTRYDLAVDGFQTTGATLTCVYTNATIPPESIVQLDAWVIGTGRTHSCAFHLNAALSTLGGSLAVLQQSNIFAYASTENLNAMALTGAPATRELRIAVTGAADEVMNWKLRGFLNSQSAP